MGETTRTPSRAMSRRRLLRAGVGSCALLAAVPASRAHEVTTATLRVVHPWSRATAPDAGFAVLCMGFDEVTQDDRLVSVASPVATHAEMGGPGGAGPVDFFIPRGRDTHLTEQTAHVRLLGLKAPLDVGTSHPVTLGFEKGGVYLTSFSVDFTRFD